MASEVVINKIDSKAKADAITSAVIERGSGNSIQYSISDQEKLSRHEKAASYITNNRLENPFEGLTREQLEGEAEEFCREAGLEEKIDYFRRGVLLAQDPKN